MSTLVFFEKKDQGYSFNHKNGSRVWSERMSNEAYFVLKQLPAYHLETAHEDEVIALLELQRLGFIELTEQGDMAVPLTMTPQGKQVVDVLAELQFEPVGTLRTFGRAPAKPKSRAVSPAAQRNLRLVGGFFLIVLAVAMFTMGYNALLSLTSFLAKVVMQGGALAEVATGMLVQSTGVFVQLLLVVVVPSVLLLYVACLQVRAAIAQAK
jgi:hypothetical protein